MIQNHPLHHITLFHQELLPNHHFLHQLQEMLKVFQDMELQGLDSNQDWLAPDLQEKDPLQGSVDLLSHFTKVKCDSWT